MAVTSLADAYNQLKAKHFSTNEIAMGSVCTRVTLRTGVSIKTPRPEQNGDPALVAKVVGALNELGYAI